MNINIHRHIKKAMTEIEEIPIVAEERRQKDEEIEQKTQDIQYIEEETAVKKSRGRPPGAKNKPKAKPPPPPPAPKPKAKAKRKKTPIYEEEDSEDSEDETPVPRYSGRRPPHVEVDRHALASEVLGILQHQRVQRTSARRNHYASWFENMS
jgi:hypothetical protein